MITKNNGVVREEDSDAYRIWSILFHTFSDFSDGKKNGQRKAEITAKIMTQQLANCTDWNKEFPPYCLNL